MTPYPTKKATPSRMTRKHDRNKIWMLNKRETKRRREQRAARIAALNEQRQDETQEAM